jgi:hypothetical protein
MSCTMCTNCCCPLDPKRGTADYCYVCEAMRGAVSDSRYLRNVQEREEHERCAARKRMGLEGE